MKKYRQAKKKKQLVHQLLTPEERELKAEARSQEASNEIKIEHMIYDYDHAQLAPHKKKDLLNLCRSLEQEIFDTKRHTTSRFQLARIQHTIKKLEVELNVGKN